ncbi:MAG: elongation factor Ts [Bacteroidetes bacterium QS_8_68_15]|nr:MAG: elongation factor Ts [Bacteroidetes bacterium QS_8_68_15]
MSISAQEVKRLRDATGVGMMDCKDALQQSDGDFDEAVSILRKKGQKVAAKRSDREADEGLIVTSVSSDGKAAAIAEVNCETDFVARNDDFRAFANGVVRLILEARPDDLDALMALDFDGDATVERALTDLTGRIGEKLAVRRFQIVEAASDGSRIVSYVHPGSRLGVLVEMNGNGEVEEAGRDVAMQVAALDPIAAFREEVPEEVQKKEKEIAREAALDSGKPEHVIDQIVEGKLRRFFEDNVLVEQAFVKDASRSVQERLDEADAGVERFVRYALGDA